MAYLIIIFKFPLVEVRSGCIAWYGPSKFYQDISEHGPLPPQRECVSPLMMVLALEMMRRIALNSFLCDIGTVRQFHLKSGPVHVEESY